MKVLLPLLFLGTISNLVFSTTSNFNAQYSSELIKSPNFDTRLINKEEISSGTTYSTVIPSDIVSTEEDEEESLDDDDNFLKVKGLGRLFKRGFRSSFSSSRSGSSSSSHGSSGSRGGSSGSRGSSGSGSSGSRGSSGSGSRGGGYHPALAGAAGGGIIYYYLWHHDRYGHSSIVSTQTSYVSENVTITSAISANGGATTSFRGISVIYPDGSFNYWTKLIPSFIVCLATVLISCM